MRSEVRLHNVASLTAELGRLHVLHGTICALGSNRDSDCGGYREEDREPAKVDTPVRSRHQPLLEACETPSGQENP